MWTDLVLLNLMGIFGCLGMTIIICKATDSCWGLLVLVLGLVFANWTWWSVYFNDFHWF